MKWMTTVATNTMGFMRDFRGQPSWGRFCSIVSLAVAVVQEYRAQSLAHIALWLGVATGSYTASKVTEMISGKSTSENTNDGSQPCSTT